jgi:hypothetical protein
LSFDTLTDTFGTSQIILTIVNMSTSKIDKLPPTKLQIRLLNVFVDELGWGGGVHSLYRHLQREFGKDRIHPAMDDNGNVLFEKGEFWEERHQPKIIKQHSYEVNGKTYTYQTRKVTRNGVSRIERRKLIPTFRVVQDFLRKHPVHQKNRMTKQAVAGGVRAPPKHSLQPVIPKKAVVLDTIFLDSFKLPPCVHNGREYSWCLVGVCILTKMIFLKEIYLNTTLSTKKAEAGQAKQTFDAFMEFLDDVEDLAGVRYHPRHIRTDAGVEFKAAFSRGIAKLQEKHDGFYNHTTTPVGRSRANAMAERAVQTARRRLYAIQGAWKKQLEDHVARTGSTPKVFKPRNWFNKGQSTSGPYDWVKDLNEVEQRIRNTYQQTIKSTPIDVLLQQNGASWDSAFKNIKQRAKRVYKDVKHNVDLPGFSPKDPEKVGDYVRIKLMQPKGLKNVRYSGKNTKSARDNWSDEVYKIVDVKTLYNRARTFKVKAIDPKITRGTISRLDRTEILKIPPDTKIDGITVQEWEKRYNAPVEPESGPESDSEDELETSLDSEIKRLRNFSAKQWSQFLRGKTFESEGTNTITAVVYRGSKFGYIVEYEDEDGKYDEYFQKVILDLAKGEDWVTDALRTVARDKKFSSKG